MTESFPNWFDVRPLLLNNSSSLISFSENDIQEFECNASRNIEVIDVSLDAEKNIKECLQEIIMFFKFVEPHEAMSCKGICKLYYPKSFSLKFDFLKNICEVMDAINEIVSVESFRFAIAISENDDLRIISAFNFM